MLELALIGLLLVGAPSSAQVVESTEDFRESVLGEAAFYQYFVYNRQYESLSPELLGSWEFADRIEHLKPQFLATPGLGVAVDNDFTHAKAAAARARGITGVEYPGTTLTFSPSEYWRNAALLPFEALKRGETLHLQELDRHFRALLIGAIYYTRIPMLFRFHQGPHQQVDIEGRIFETGLTAHFNGFITVVADQIHRFVTDTGVTANPGEMFAMSIHSSIQLSPANRIAHVRRLSKVMRVDLIGRLLEGEHVPSPFLSQEESARILEIYRNAGFFVGIQNGLAHLQSLEAFLTNVKNSRKRELGVRPCERILTE